MTMLLICPSKGYAHALTDLLVAEGWTATQFDSGVQTDAQMSSVYSLGKQLSDAPERDITPYSTLT